MIVNSYRLAILFIFSEYFLIATRTGGFSLRGEESCLKRKSNDFNLQWKGQDFWFPSRMDGTPSSVDSSKASGIFL